MKTAEEIAKDVFYEHGESFSFNKQKEVIVSCMERYAEQFKPQPKLSIEERKRNFGLSLQPFANEYSREMLKDFRDYWCEHSPNGKKLRFEREKVFDVKLRLIRWSKNQKQNGNKKTGHNIDNALAFANAVLRGEVTDPNFTGTKE